MVTQLVKTAEETSLDLVEILYKSISEHEMGPSKTR